MTSGSSTLSLLRLTLVEGVGPILGRRLIAALGSGDSVFTASAADLERVEGIGPAKARRIHASIHASESALEREIELIEKARARVIALGDPEYPPLLAEAPDAPLILYVRGSAPCPTQSFPVGIVGSRHCTAYGTEQAERFSAILAQQGLVIVSGGARGIDSAAHRAALRVGGTTVVVMGCGLGNCYPPENAPLFDDIAARGGTIVSELPISTGPAPENFPARNRIIAAMSLGVLVIEAPRGSGALITARVAIDDYNRDVLAVPGRIDSRASEGSNELLKSGQAAIATSPADVIDALESAARHHNAGTHVARFAPDAPPVPTLFHPPVEVRAPAPPDITQLTAEQKAIVEAAEQPASITEICRKTGLDPAKVMAETTILEIRRILLRQGPALVARKS